MTPQRLIQVAFVVEFILLCWFSMQAVHELGHVAGALATGETIRKVVLHPLAISRTDIALNAHPLVTTWAGPLIGSLLPCALLLRFTRVNHVWSALVRFFAGFCFIANGLYVGLGSFYGIGDAGELLRHGSSTWLLQVFGLAAVGMGLHLWHKQGPKLGWERVRSEVSPRNTFILSATLVGWLALSLSLFSRS